MKKSFLLRLTFMLILGLSVQMAYSQNPVYKCVEITKNGDPWWASSMNDDYYCLQFNDNGTITRWWWDKSKQTWTNEKVFTLQGQDDDGSQLYTHRQQRGVVYGRQTWRVETMAVSPDLNSFTSLSVNEGGPADAEELIFTYRRTN